MIYPENSRAAARMVKKSAKEAKMSLSAFCISKGLHPTVVYNWWQRDAGYEKPLLDRLMASEQHPANDQG